MTGRLGKKKRPLWKTVLGWAATVVLLPVFAFLFFMLLFAAPLDLAWSSWNLLRPSIEGEALILESTEVPDRGTKIRYEFQTPEGTNHTSERYHSGWRTFPFGSGDSEISNQFREGDRVPVHIPVGNSEAAFLVRGWSTTSLGWFALVLGMVLTNIFDGPASPRHLRDHLGMSCGVGLCVGGFYLLLFADNPVFGFADVPKFLSVIAVGTAIGFLWAIFPRKSRQPSPPWSV